MVEVADFVGDDQGKLKRLYNYPGLIRSAMQEI
jgi:hypothetical protein